MRHTWSVLVLLAVAALVAYVATSRPVQAQTGALPVLMGEIVTFSFQDGDTRRCRIDQIHGMFVRCGDPSDQQGPIIGRREQPEHWVNVAVVEWVTKARDQR